MSPRTSPTSSDEVHFVCFRDEVAEQHQTDRIHLLFNNAGIGGGGSLFTNTREQWERTFDICWGGVYLGTRSFMPMLLKADAGDSDSFGAEEIVTTRARPAAAGVDAAKNVRRRHSGHGGRAGPQLPRGGLTGAAQAATIIIDGVKAERWRILVGDDAPIASTSGCARPPDRAYDAEFYRSFATEVGWRLG